MNSNEIIPPTINAEKIEKMKIRIIDLEREYLKTKASPDADILEEIRKIIIEEANKNY
jgi:hypothetical protein